MNWVCVKRGELAQNKSIIVVAEEIARGSEVILRKIGWGNELRKLAGSAPWKLI